MPRCEHEREQEHMYPTTFSTFRQAQSLRPSPMGEYLLYGACLNALD
jgi:hypothetical protein